MWSVDERNVVVVGETKKLFSGKLYRFEELPSLAGGLQGSASDCCKLVVTDFPAELTSLLLNTPPSRPPPPP